MKIEDYFLKDSSTGTPSTTRTVFFVGCCICLFKLLISGITIWGLGLGNFTGGDFALAIGALGGIYALDKTVSKTNA